jgi:hypothetical protein
VELGKFKNLNDYPFHSNVLTAYEVGLGGMVRPIRGAEATVDAQSGEQFLCVRDLKERMPLWEAFVARHNAEPARPEPPMSPIPPDAVIGGKGK